MKKKDLSLQELFAFMDMMNEFREVERVIKIKGSSRKENSLEHSYSLAMLAWYIIDTQSLDINLEKVLKYALVHDLVEVYAGDTFIYGPQEELDAKEEKEHQAAKRLKQEFPKFSSLHTLIQEYEKQEDKEARFVYALDKIHPVIQIYLDKGRSWQETKTSLNKLLDSKISKVSKDPIAQQYFEEFCVLLKENGHYFHQE